MYALIIDDSRAMRRILRQIVQPLGFDILEAGDGQEGLDQLSAHPDEVEMTLVDWNMPVMNGIDFLRLLRAEPDGGTPKVVFCSVETEPDRIREALDAGASEYIMKPFDGDIIEAKFAEAGLV